MLGLERKRWKSSHKAWAKDVCSSIKTNTWGVRGGDGRVFSGKVSIDRVEPRPLHSPGSVSGYFTSLGEGIRRTICFLWNTDFGQPRAILECSPADFLYAVGNGDFGQPCATGECVFADFLYSVGDGNNSQPRTIRESAEFGCAVGDGDFCQPCANRESAPADFRNAVGDGDFYQPSAPTRR